MASTGKIYKSHLATIRSWAKRDEEKAKAGRAGDRHLQGGGADPIPQAIEDLNGFLAHLGKMPLVALIQQLAILLQHHLGGGGADVDAKAHFLLVFHNISCPNGRL